MEDAGIPTSEQLMAEMAWVRQLARALVKDDALADDVAQDTWIVAARQQPDTDRPLRPWLGRVVRNLIMTRRRSEVRRNERAVASDSERPVPTPADLIERVELQRALADELLGLAEPYRSTVLLHFVEGYSSAEIARRLGIPDATVRRRLKTALDQLREALGKRTDQPKRGWLAALIPLSKLPVASPASTALGVFAMKKVIAIVVVLVLLLLIGAGALWRYRAGKDESSSSSSSSGSLTKAGAHASGVAGDPGSTSTIPAWLAKAGAPPRRIAGRVVFHGAPVAGAKVVLGFEVAGQPGPFILTPDPILFAVLQPIAEVTSAADGTFDFGVQPPLPFVVSASATKYASAAAHVDNASPLSKSDQVVVALGDCGSRLYGTIADASGGGIAKAHIAVAGLNGADSDATGAYSV
ncbi:MAG: RNA polymerase sigma factor, partial [Kofleriaceae bacterium]|nr:RNA polymerase sigma factor [Kofleriaceae bacterium]